MFVLFVDRSRGFVFLPLALSLLCGCSRSQPKSTVDPLAEPRQMIAEQRYGEAIQALDEQLQQSPGDSESLYWRGVSHHRLGHVDLALQDYSAAIREGFIRPDVYSARGDLYLQQKLGEVAAADFEDALRLQPNDAEMLCKLSEAYVQANRWDRALVAARQAIRLQPGYVAAYRALAAAAQESPSEDYAESIAALERAHHLAPRNNDIALELAGVYCRQAVRLERLGEVARAKALWQSGEALDPTAVAYYRHSARATGPREPNRHVTARMPSDTAAGSTTFAEGQPDQPSARDIGRQLADAGRELLAAGKTREAIDKSTAALARDPKAAEHYLLRGQAFCAEASYESAIADLTEAIRLDANLAQAYADRGRAYRLNKNPSGALYDLTEAMRRDPALVDAYVERGKAYFDLARYDMALADYENGLKRDPKRAATIQPAQAQCSQRLGRQQIADRHWDEAIAHLYEAERLDPSLKAELTPLEAEALRGRAVARADRGETDEAWNDAKRAIDLDGQNAKSYDALARVQIKRAEWPAALESLRMATQLDPASVGNLRVTLADAYRGWGDALAASRRYAEALPHLNRAVDLSPLNGQHVLARGKAYYYLGRFSEARDDFNTALRRAPELDPQVSPYLAETNRRLGLAQTSRR